MRIISGDLKGKNLFSIKGKTTRPTSDRLRESIFNILSNHLNDAFVLDLFAGTGALGIEAISRGALFSYFIDNKTEAIWVIQKNINACKLEDKSGIIQWDIRKSLRCIETLTNKINLIFMDPPYNANLIKPALLNLQQSGCMQTGARIVIEHSLYETIPC
ncbi:MAG: 16S rRNA (guanine(966)-N(2))-methyltransferase RsmD, partial [Desulfobacterales bacterium]|nr:16S rRNA (guanine(966)-N(2))-methyltransferase RsmD [Desulfobacterales bacterium]